jgi:hypothetical protein
MLLLFLLVLLLLLLLLLLSSSSLVFCCYFMELSVARLLSIEWWNDSWMMISKSCGRKWWWPKWGTIMTVPWGAEETHDSWIVDFPAMIWTRHPLNTCQECLPFEPTSLVCCNVNRLVTHISCFQSCVRWSHHPMMASIRSRQTQK